MQDKFEKFTERARRVLTLAQDEAHRFNHSYIGTEHLLLGLVREREGVAARVLTKMGASEEQVRNAVEFIIGHGDAPAAGEIGLTPRGKKVLELAVQEARQLNHHYIGTEHLLLGLIAEGEGIAAGVLESLGIRLESARDEVLKVINSGVPLPESEPSRRRQALTRQIALTIGPSATQIGLIAMAAGVAGSLLTTRRPRLLPSLATGALAGLAAAALEVLRDQRKSHAHESGRLP